MIEPPKTDRHPRTTDGPELPSDGDTDLLQAVLEQAGRAHAVRNSNLKLVDEYSSSGNTAGHNDRVRVHDDIGIPYIHSQAILTGKDEHGLRIVPLEPAQLFEKAIDSGKRLVFLVGKVGTGKTLLALKWLENYPISKYVKARKLCSFVERYDEDRARLNLYLKCRNLVIDEMGTEREVDIGTLADHIHTRYEDGKITIGIANLNKAEVMSRYKDPIARRLWALGAVIECTKTVCPGQMEREKLAKKRRR